MVIGQVKVIPGHGVSNVKVTFLYIGFSDTCFWVSFSSKIHKITLKHTFRSTNRSKIRIQKTVKNHRRMTIFGQITEDNSFIFEDVASKCCTHVPWMEMFDVCSICFILGGDFSKIYRKIYI